MKHLSNVAGIYYVICAMESVTGTDLLASAAVHWVPDFEQMKVENRII